MFILINITIIVRDEINPTTYTCIKLYPVKFDSD